MLKLLLIPAAWLYGLAIRFRHYLFDSGLIKSHKFDIPVICVGNITVGGTGKTPMAEMIIGYMSRFHHVALLSRGYGRRTKGYLEVRPDVHYCKVGDEPLQIKRKFPDIVVAVCEKRVEGIRRIRHEHPEIDLVILDDAFQHRYVEPKINVVMIDSTRPIQHDHLLPYGTLRDLPEQLHRANCFVVTKCPENMSPIERRIWQKVLVKMAYQSVYFARTESFRPQPVFPKDADAQEVKPGAAVIALSGIGNPEAFVSGLKAGYNVLCDVRYEDHHIYRRRDMARMAQLLRQHPEAIILTTEKDSVKLLNPAKMPEVVRRKLYYVPINISFIDNSKTDFLQKLENNVRKN